MSKYIIIPPCSDFNRGDQALVWETVRFAKDAGFGGDFYFMAEAKEPVKQSIAHGLKSMVTILDHPSKRFNNRNNIAMDWRLLLKWGSVSLIDLTWSLLLLTRLRFLIIPFLSKEKKRSMDLFKYADAIFVKGGGFIHSYGGVTSLYYIYFQLYHIFLAHALGKDVFICPNSYGPFEGLGVRAIVKSAFKKAKLVTARETRSANMCKQELGMDIPTYPDFGFFLQNSNINNKEDFYKANNIPTNRKLVAITVRPHRFPNSEDPTQAYNHFVESIRHFAVWLYSEGYFPVFIEHVYAVNNHENDSYCIQHIIKGMSEDKYAYFSNRHLNCCQLKRIYSYFDYIVGTRFHSVIFSMSNYVPGIAITYVGNKGEGIMEDMDMKDYYVQIGNVDFEVLRDKFQFLLKTEVDVINKIQKYLNTAQIKRQKLVEQVSKL